ncbi:MAG: hypothetical protein WAZ94_14530 [Phycisphaerales bacterium]
MRTAPALILSLAASAALAQSQYLMIPDSGTSDRVMLFDASTGALINADFIPDAASPYLFTTPKEAIQVGNEIWVSDQVADAIHRFTASLTPQYLSTISGGLDNIRGLGRVGDRIYVSNSGTGNGAPGPAIVAFNLDGSPAGSFACPDPFDVVDFHGKLMVTDIAGDDIRVFLTDGTLDSVFHNSDGVNGIDFPEQAIILNTGAGGAEEVWATGFTAPAGIYRYDSDGGQVAYYNVSTGPRGLWPLSDGQMLFTEGSAVKIFNPATGDPAVTVFGGSGSGVTPQFIGLLTLAPACDPDLNQDGNVDQDDIAYLINVVGGGENPTGIDPDFNQDGNVDQDDVGSLINTVGGGGCP